MNFTKKELASLLEAIEASRACASRADLKDIIIKVKDLSGAEHSACGLGQMTSEGLSEGIVPLNGNYPDEWIDIYVSQKLFYKDPVVRYHTRHMSSCLWSSAVKAFDDGLTDDFMRLASDFNLTRGISSGITDTCSGAISIFSFAGKHCEGLKNKKIIDTLTPHLHAALVRIHEGPLIGRMLC